jgi:hypothetical protein
VVLSLFFFFSPHNSLRHVVFLVGVLGIKLNPCPNSKNHTIQDLFPEQPVRSHTHEHMLARHSSLLTRWLPPEGTSASEHARVVLQDFNKNGDTDLGLICSEERDLLRKFW